MATRKREKKLEYISIGEFSEEGAYTYGEMFDDFGVSYRKKRVGPDYYELLVDPDDFELAGKLAEALGGDYYNIEKVGAKVLGVEDIEELEK